MSQQIEFHFDNPATVPMTIVLAHGAGVAMDTPFMAANDLRVFHFEFPYMAHPRQTDQQRPPDREPVLHETWRAVIEQLGADLGIGGRALEPQPGGFYGRSAVRVRRTGLRTTSRQL